MTDSRRASRTPCSLWGEDVGSNRAALVREVDGPINVVMGLAGGLLSVDELQKLGVRRISIGGSLARATFVFARNRYPSLNEAAASMKACRNFGW